MGGAIHDPGAEAAGRVVAICPTARVTRNGATVRVGTAGWTDKTRTTKGVSVDGDD